MTLIKDGSIRDDPFLHCKVDDFTAPASAPVLCTFTTWLEKREELCRTARLRAVRLEPEDPVELLREDLEWLDAVLIQFPKFTDGRGFSQARQLRQDFGYSGEIRAIGGVLPDQAHFLARCGIDAVDIADAADLALWQRHLTHFRSYYQPHDYAAQPSYGGHGLHVA